MSAPSSDGVAVSIVVPCYNAEKTLPACLGSLVAQTLPNMEVVCVDDGSTDGTRAVLEDWRRRHPALITVVGKRNQGAWHARRDGIGLARGAYIGFLDSDDTAEPNFADLLYQTATSCDADMAVCGFWRTDQDTQAVLSTEMCAPRSPFCLRTEPGRFVEINTAPWNKLFRADVLRRTRDLACVPPSMEDLMFHLLFYLEARGTVAFCPQPLVHYMQRAGSITTTISHTQARSIQEAMAEVKRHYVDCGADYPLQAALDASALLHLGIALTYRLTFDPHCDVRAAVRDSRRYLDRHFPTWRRSPYVNARYALRHGPTYQRLLVAARMYQLGLLPALLQTYRFVTEHAHVDVKW